MPGVLFGLIQVVDALVRAKVKMHLHFFFNIFFVQLWNYTCSFHWVLTGFMFLHTNTGRKGGQIQDMSL